jgi:hypothetical protein
MNTQDYGVSEFLGFNLEKRTFQQHQHLLNSKNHWWIKFMSLNVLCIMIQCTLQANEEVMLDQLVTGPESNSVPTLRPG